MTEKITGYALLGIGIFLIVVSAISVFQVFTGAAKPVQIFNLSGISIDIASQMPTGLKSGAPPAEIIPAAMLNDTSNLFAHLFLMGFIASIGQKLAGLGVQLVRPIVVKLNESKTA